MLPARDLNCLPMHVQFFCQKFEFFVLKQSSFAEFFVLKQSSFCSSFASYRILSTPSYVLMHIATYTST